MKLYEEVEIGFNTDIFMECKHNIYKVIYKRDFRWLELKIRFCMNTFINRGINRSMEMGY